MSKDIEILKHLIEYLQDKIDSGYHKIFYNDLMYDEKTVDCINAINEVIKENKRLNNRIEKAKHFIDQVLGYHLSSGYEQLDKDVNELYGILKGEDKE